MTQAVTATGQVAHDAGMSFEELAAISAKVAERTREDGSSIGNAMKTIITRISKVNKMPQYADEIDSSTVSKASESLAAVGINVYQPNGEQNDMITILSQLREKWDDLTDAQQANIAFNIAATRQTSKFKNILMAWTDSMELAEHATNAQGGALENQEKYEESIVGKTQKIRTELDSFWIDLYNSDATKGILDFVIKLTEGFNELADAVSPLGALLATAFSSIMIKSAGGGLFSLLKNKNGLQSFGNAIKMWDAKSILTEMQRKAVPFEEAQRSMMAQFGGVGFEKAVDYKGLQKVAASGKATISTLGKVTIAFAALAAAAYATQKAYEKYGMSADAVIKRNQKVVNQEKEKSSSLKEEINENEDNAKSLQSLLNQYEAATVGSSEYYNIRQQIANQFSNLVVGYNDEGQAIIKSTEAIREQIKAYQDLADSRKKDLKDQAARTINTLTGKGINPSAQKETISVLKKQKKNLSLRLDALQNTDAFDYLPDWAKGIFTEITSSDLTNTITALSENNTLLYDSFTLLSDGIDESNESLVSAVGYLKEYAIATEMDPKAYQNFINNMSSNPKQYEGFIEASKNYFDVDSNEIKAYDYLAEMYKRFNEVREELHQNPLTLSDFLSFADENGIKQYADALDQQINNIIQNYSDTAKKLGIENWSEVVKSMSTQQIDTFSENYFSDLFQTNIKAQYADLISQLGKETVLSLSDEITNPQGWGIASQLTEIAQSYDFLKSEGKDAILELINLMGQWGWITNDTADGMRESFTDFQMTTSNSLNQLTTANSSISSAFSELNKDGHVSKDTLNTLIGTNEKYKDAIIETTEGITLNVQKVKQLRDEQQKDITDGIIKEREKLNEQYELNQESLAYYTNELHKTGNEETLNKAEVLSKIDALNQSNIEIQNNISSLRELENELRGTSNAWADWQAAVSSGNAMDQYDAIESWLDTWKDLHEKGRVGREDYQEFGHLLTGETDRDIIASDSFYNQVSEMAKRYVTEDRTGMEQLASDVSSVLKSNGLNDWFNEDGGIIIKNDELLAQLLSEHTQELFGEYATVSTEFLQKMLQGSPDLNWGNPEEEGTYSDRVDYLDDVISWLEKEMDALDKDSEKWEAYNKILENTKQEKQDLELLQNTFQTQDSLNELEKNVAESLKSEEPIEVPIEVKTEEEARNVINQLREQEYQLTHDGNTPKASIDVDQEALENVHALLQYYESIRQSLSQPIIMQIDTTQLEGAEAEYVQALQNFNQANNELKIARIGGDQTQIDEAQEKVNELVETIQKLGEENPEIKLHYGIDDTSDQSIWSSLLHTDPNVITPPEEANSVTINMDVNDEQAQVVFAGISQNLDELQQKGHLIITAEDKTDLSNTETPKVQESEPQQSVQVVKTEKPVVSGPASVEPIIVPTKVDTGELASQAQDAVSQVEDEIPEIEAPIKTTVTNDEMLANPFGELTPAIEEVGALVDAVSAKSTGDFDSGKTRSEMDATITKVGQVGTAVDSASGHRLGDFGAYTAKSAFDGVRSAVEAIGRAIDAVNRKKINPGTSSGHSGGGTPGGSTDSSGGSGGYKGTASFARGTWSFGSKAAAHGDIGAKKTETALVGELGPEIRVRGSKWQLLGADGPEFTDVRKGDIIFNHKQTKNLMERGHTNSRGQVAFAGGTAFAGEWDIDTNKKSTKKTTVKTKKGKTTTHSDSNDSNKTEKQTDKALENFKKALENIVDWIEVKLSRQTDKIDGYISKAESALDKASSTLTTTAGLWAKKNYYRTASSNRQKAISAIYDQIGNENRGSQYYYQFADAQMATARKKGLITKKEETTYKKLVKNGQITSRKDIEALVDKHIDMTGRKLSEKDKKQEATRLYEAINVYKEWYEKGYEAEKAMAELNEQLREQVKALKEIRDAERDARIERSKTLTQIKTGGFQTTSDTDATYSNLLLDSSNADLDLSNRAYASETGALTKQKNKYGKYANKAFSAARSEVKRTTRGKGKGELRAKLYKKIKNLEKRYKKKIQAYVKKNEIIPDSIINEIQKASPDAAARLITYNETIGNWQRGLLEEVAAYAENNAAKVANTNSKYQNKEQAFSNDISLKEAQKNNRTTASGKNSLLNDEIGIQRDITTNAKNRLGDFEKQLNDLTGKVKGTNVKSMVKKMGLSTSEEVEVQKAVNAADGKNPIPNIDQLADLYSKGKISQNFMYWCINYNDALEAKKEAEYAYLIAQETEKQENSARALEQVKNFRDEADYNMQSRLGNNATTYSLRQANKNRFTYNPTDSNEQRITRAKNHISLAGTQGYYAQESDYDEQLQMSNRNMQILLDGRAKAINQFNDRVKSGDLVPGTPDYASALEVINGFTNDIESLTENIIELSKAKRQLKWTEFDDAIASVKRFNAEINHYLNLLDNQTLFDDENKGNATEYGMAALDLRMSNYSAYMAETKKYADEIEALQKRINSQQDDIADKDVRDRLEQLTDAYWESVEATEAEKQAVIDLVRQAYEAQLSYLNKTIDKYKELKNAEKDAYDYQKQISESAKNITNLEKQLAAYEGNTSEEAVARVQKLRADLKEAKQNQSDQQYDKYLSDSQKMLDDLSNNFQEWIESHMKDRDAVIEEAAQVIAGNINNLGSTDFAKTTVSTLNNLEAGLGGKVDSLSSALTRSLNTDDNKTTADILNGIFGQISQYIAEQPDREAATEFETRAEAYKDIDKITLDDEASINQLVDYYNGLTTKQKEYVSKDIEKIYNDAVAKIGTLRKAENDRLAKEAEQKRLNDIAKQAAETAKITTQNKAAEEKARAMDEDTKNKQREAQADADAKAKASSKKTVDSKEQSILGKIEDVQNQIKNNRNSYKATTKETDKAKLDLAYHKLKVQLDELNQQLAEYRNNKSVVGKAVAAAVVKGKGFASGSKYVKKDQLAYTQEKGQEVIYRKSDGAMLTPLGKGDKVFTNAMTENLWKLAQMNIPDMINSAMSQPIVQNTNQNISQSMGDVQFVFNLPNVTNYDQFKSQLVADKQFQSALQEMTLGAAMGRNSLSKYKYAN